MELYNNYTSVAYDLSGWQMPVLSYTFPAGSVLQAGGYLVLAGTAPAFAAAYGSTKVVFDTLASPPEAGQLLSLEQPVAPTTLVGGRSAI